MGAVVSLEPMLADQSPADDSPDSELATVLSFSRASSQRVHPALGRAAAVRASEGEADDLHGDV